MNAERLAALYVRFTGLMLFFSAITSATSLPYETATAQIAHSKGIDHSTADLLVQDTLMRVVLQLLMGSVLLIGWRQIVHLLTAGLSLVKKNEAPPL